MDKAAVCRYTWPSAATHFTTEAAFCLPSPVFSPAHALGCTQARNPAQTSPLSFQCPFEGSHQCLDLFSLSGSLSKSFNSHPALFKQKPELTGLLPWGGFGYPRSHPVFSLKDFSLQIQFCFLSKLHQSLSILRFSDSSLAFVLMGWKRLL